MISEKCKIRKKEYQKTDKYRAWQNEYRKEYREKNKEKLLEYNRLRRIKYPEVFKQYRLRHKNKISNNLSVD